MPNSNDYKKEWFAKARVNYYSAFVNLWLACNSWYNFHYATLTSDRDHVDMLKTDISRQNVLYKKFESIFSGALTKEQKSLFANLELLHYSLNRTSIQPSKLIKPLNFSSVLIDYNQKNANTGYADIIIQNAKTKNGSLKANISGVDLGDVVISNDTLKVFAGILETIYQVRCMLVHGELDPTDENHEVVKYCYLVLYDLMKDFCS